MARPRWMRAGPWASVTAQLAFVAAYLGAAKWAVEFNTEGPVLLWFPPAAVAIAGFALLGLRLLPALVAAEAISTHWVTGFGAAYDTAQLAVNSLTIVGSYAVAGELLRRFDVDLARRKATELLRFTAIAVIVGPVLATVCGIAVLVWIGLVPSNDALHQGALFWVGDAVAVAALTPTLLLVGGALRQHEAVPWTDRRPAEPNIVVLGEYLVPALVGTLLFAATDQPGQFLYLVIFPATLVALRHGIIGAAVSSAAMCAVMTVGADLETSAALERSDLQLLMGAATFASLVVGTVVSDRMRTTQALADVSAIVEATPDLVGTAAPDGTLRYLNPVGRQLLRLPPGADISQFRATEFFADPLARNLLDEAMRSAQREGVWSGENTIRSPDGRVIAVSQVLVSHRDPDGGVAGFSTVMRDIGPHRQLEDQLRRAALYDDTTGLPNRALLTEQIGHGGWNPGGGRSLVVLLVDIDRFRQVNESMGYATGDLVLGELARRLRGAVSPRDLVARHGGDLFAVVLGDDADEFEGVNTADAIGHALSQPLVVEGRALVITASIGVSVSDPTTTDGLDAVRSAEVALHRAKEDGGGRIRVFDSEMDVRAKERMELESDLRRAMDSDEWWLAFQPIVVARSREVISCEALLRWHHPTRGPIAPYDAVVMAERTGLIVPLGLRILERACTESAALRHAGHELRVAVNVSGRQLVEDSFADDLESVLRRTGARPESITLEITETTLAADPAIVPVLESARRLGCHIAVDDFGTGYSSLATLRDLPIDILKLDRSFITDLASSGRSAATVRSVIRLADDLDLVVVAEGVEDDQQYELLKGMGCHHIQGYAVSHPISSDDLHTMLSAPSADARLDKET